METTEVTPRTWYSSNSGNDHQGSIIEEGTGKSIAICYDRRDKDMLAAALDMYYVLQHIDAMALDAYFRGHPEWEYIARQTYAAIAKAEGKL